MGVNNYILAGYGIFLLILLAINLLYFFQVFKYRLPGDASVSILILHIILVISIMSLGTFMVLG